MNLNNRIASLELIRFLSSIAVVIFHYKNILVGNDTESLARLPFNNILNFLYIYGHYGVHVFFSISGFIFAYTYLDKNTSAKIFFLNRFARLYPLHFLTLMLIVFFQLLDPLFFQEYNQINNVFSDFYHFFLQVFFISSWGLENGSSFNTPIWSVSVEVILYIIFFTLIRYLKIGINCLIILTLIFTYKSTSINIKYDVFAALFFLGVLIYQILKFEKKNIQLLIALIFLIFSVIGNFKILLFAPSLVMVAALIDKYILTKNRVIFVNLGSITYSTYLTHYPLLILILMVENKFLNLSKFYFNNIFFIIFFIFLVLFSFVVFRYAEKPINKIIRNNLLK